MSPLRLAGLLLLLAVPVRAADYRPGDVVLARRGASWEEVKVIRIDAQGVFVQQKSWDGTFSDDASTAPTRYYQPNDIRSRTAAPPAREPGPAGQAPGPRPRGPREGQARQAGGHRPGDVLYVKRGATWEEVRFVRQDQHGILVQQKSWDGTFSEDPTTAPTRYYPPDEVRKTPPGAGPRERPADGGQPPEPDGPGPVGPAEPGPGQAPGVDGPIPEGEYICYGQFDLGGKPLVLGNFTIQGNSYRSSVGATGRYRLAGGGRIEFQGAPPLGFEVGVLEQTTPKGLIRLYPHEVGDKWKAAVCSQKDGAGNPQGPGAGRFAPGSRVETSYAGLWYPGTVKECNASQCRVKYDNPEYDDQWVPLDRLRAKR